MRILAIETSCDDTSSSVVENGNKVLSNIISSQISVHAKYNGVVPELASREHIKNVNIVVEQALKQANISFEKFDKKIDYITCTYGPGLAGSLLVGVMTAKTLSYIYKKPLIPINHIEGHIFSAAIENKDLKCRPCSKLGYKKCPKGHFKCMMNINTDEVVSLLRTE